MKKLILLALAISATTLLPAQTDSTALRIKQLQAEAEQKAQAAAQAAAAASQAAKEAADAAAKLAAEAKTQSDAAAAQAAKKTVAPAARQEAKVVETVPKQEVKAEAKQQVAKAATSTEEWKAPEVEEKKKSADSWDDSYDFDKNSSVYVGADAVPVVDGEVQWVCNLPNTGKTDAQLKKGVDEFIKKLKGQKAVTTVTPLPTTDGSQSYAVVETLTFTANFISLDQTQFSYVLEAKEQNGNASLTMSNLRYNYKQNNKMERYSAEEWIVDKYAVNKKHTRLLPITGKFRRKTIDRKNELFQQFKDIVL